MLNGGISLDTKSTWDRWPSYLPLLIYHGEQDPICDAKAAQRFHDGVGIPHKKIKIFDVSLDLCLCFFPRLSFADGVNDHRRQHRACSTKFITSLNLHPMSSRS